MKDSIKREQRQAVLHFLMFALLCAFAQGVWAQITNPFAYDDVWNGSTTTSSLTAACSTALSPLPTTLATAAASWDDADHTGCIYLGVFNDTSDEPLAIYGGPDDAGFTWHLLADGTLLLGDPVTGETYTLSRSVTRALTRNGNSYGEGMTDVSTTSMTYTDNSVTVTNDNYSGTLVKADAETAADIEEKLQTGNVNTNLPGSDALNIDHTPGSGWGR